MPTKAEGLAESETLAAKTNKNTVLSKADLSL